jgi:V/A-type H+-transporting ATPase subunit D
MKPGINPNRMELLKLRKRLATATRGHKLLKDKLEGLIQDFMEYLEGYRKARRGLDDELPRILRLFVLAGLRASPDVIEAAVTQSRAELALTAGHRRLMGVEIPTFDFRIEPGEGYSFLNTPPELDRAVESLKEYFPRILDLAEREEGIRRLLAEIERTRRRVNALEYVIIPDVRATIREIKMKLDELERGNVTRLMKIKEMRLTQERQAGA